MIARDRGDLGPLIALIAASGFLPRICADGRGSRAKLPLICTDHTDQEIAEIAEATVTKLSIALFIRVHPRKSAVKKFLISVISGNQW